MSVGAILMSASTVVVALNAQLLRRLDLTPAASAARSLDRAPETLDAYMRHCCDNTGATRK